MDIKSKISELRKEKSQLDSRISAIDGEISQLQQQCDHPENSLRVSGERVLEPRWAYEQAYSYEPTGERMIEVRFVSCTICGKGRHEMRFSDSEWLESYVWEERARAEARERY